MPEGRHTELIELARDLPLDKVLKQLEIVKRDLRLEAVRGGATEDVVQLYESGFTALAQEVHELRRNVDDLQRTKRAAQGFGLLVSACSILGFVAGVAALLRH